jgi:hypothetical protein
METMAMLRSPVRTRYFDGRLLTADDLGRDQQYHRDARQRLLLMAVGSGVVTGLRITRASRNGIDVSAGVAIDAVGREIMVPADVELRTDAPPRAGAFVVLRYAEELIEPTPTVDGAVEYAAVRETYQLSVSAKRPTTGQPDAAVVIGKVPAAPRGAKRKSRKS